MYTQNSVKATATINILAGIWLFISPWIYQAYKLHDAWNSWIVGFLIFAFGAIRVSNPEVTRAASIINMLLGIWTFCSPWIYNYSGDNGRLVNSLCVGAIVFVLGAVGSSMGRTASVPPPLHP